MDDDSMTSPVRDFESRWRAIITAITVPAGKRSYMVNS